MRLILKSIYSDLFSFIIALLRLGRNRTSTTVIFSMPRSGSTMFMNLISLVTSSVQLFEPFNAPEHYNVYLRDYESSGFISPKNLENNRFKRIIRDVLKGHRISRWSASHDSFSKFITSNNLVIKLLNFNLFYEYISEEYVDIKSIIFIRHPGAVYESIIRSNRNGGFDVYTSLDYLNRKLNYINLKAPSNKSLNDMDIDERFILFWCIEYLMLIKSYKSQSQLVHYEDIIKNPANTIKEVCKYLSKDFSNVFINSITKRSSTSDIDSASKKDPVSYWMQVIDNSTKEKFQAYLDHFKITVYSMNDVLPKSII